MTKLDDIENRNKNFFSLTCRSFVDDMDYMIKLARKAEEMANFYAGNIQGWESGSDNGAKAKEFLSFLEKGE